MGLAETKDGFRAANNFLLDQDVRKNSGHTHMPGEQFRDTIIHRCLRLEMQQGGRPQSTAVAVPGSAIRNLRLPVISHDRENKDQVWTMTSATAAVAEACRAGAWRSRQN
jgi:hypothetical protein